MIVREIQARSNQLRSWFEDLHAHPELGFEEYRTAEIVATKLHEFGVDEVHENIGGTGVVGILHGRGSDDRAVGLRADMDALPIVEKSGVAYSSRIPGVMHACGHDGHTSMLLGAAHYLAETRRFDGMVALIFQPAEEGLGGARRMIAEGLFERFRCDEIYGLHNWPDGTLNRVTIAKGAAMAGAMFFDITISGRGSHAAVPEESSDVLVVASSLVVQIQTIVSRNISPVDACVLSVTKINGGRAYNIVPAEARLGGTIRFLRDEIGDRARQRLEEICRGAEAAYGVQIEVRFRAGFDVLVNQPAFSDALLAAAASVVGGSNISDKGTPVMISEDFADMLNRVPGAYCWLSHSGREPLHSPAFVLDPGIIPVGASIFARLVEQRLAPEHPT